MFMLAKINAPQVFQSSTVVGLSLGIVHWSYDFLGWVQLNFIGIVWFCVRNKLQVSIRSRDLRITLNGYSIVLPAAGKTSRSTQK